MTHLVPTGIILLITLGSGIIFSAILLSESKRKLRKVKVPVFKMNKSPKNQ